uniref:Uncharacterized protein n=1 Tax=Physcomitrium patens TaxID=3218 RepID=A0A2K1LB30_PHYPA|nr:hypothetical protein PHYPA_001646 [Physcomitrium patens]
MENMRLQEQLCKLEHFHTNGEREAMTQEISDLRDQISALQFNSEPHCGLLWSLFVDFYCLCLWTSMVFSVYAFLKPSSLMTSPFHLQLVDLLGIKLSLDSPAHSQEIHSAVKVAADRHQDSQMKTLEVNYLELKNAQHQQHLFVLKTRLSKLAATLSEKDLLSSPKLTSVVASPSLELSSRCLLSCCEHCKQPPLQSGARKRGSG